VFFSNTSAALVKGNASYRDGKYELISGNWQVGLKTAESIRAGAAQANRDFSSASRDTLEVFYRSNHPQAFRRGRELRFIVSPHLTGCWRRLRRLSDRHSRGMSLYRSDSSRSGDCTADHATHRAGNRVRVVTADILTDKPEGSFDAAVRSSVIQVISPE
jgi:hypothetical protein